VPATAQRERKKKVSGKRERKGGERDNWIVMPRCFTNSTYPSSILHHASVGIEGGKRRRGRGSEKEERKKKKKKGGEGKKEMPR